MLLFLDFHLNLEGFLTEHFNDIAVIELKLVIDWMTVKIFDLKFMFFIAHIDFICKAFNLQRIWITDLKSEQRLEYYQGYYINL